MNKLRLSLDDLTVDTFSTASAEERRRGTVEAHSGGYTYSCYGTCEWTCDPTCGRQWTCEGTCDRTCGPPDTCGWDYCGTYPDQGCPNSYWYCTSPDMVC